MMANGFKGEIKWFGIVSQDDADKYVQKVKEAVELNCRGLYVEIQYQPTMQPNGRQLYTATIIGRQI